MDATVLCRTMSSNRHELIHTGLGFDLIVDPGDYLSLLLSRDGIFEVPETDLVSRIVRAGDTCIDAGCHVGYYSCLMAKLAGNEGRLIAFDANPQACESTRRNLRLNGLASSEVVQAALADRDGNLPFQISSDDQTGLSSLGPIPTSKETISVPCIRLDGFLDGRRIERIRLLKLDVEGAEEIVLKGLGRYLTDHAVDFLLVECYDERLRLLGTSTEKVAALLQSSGYSCWEFGAQYPAGWSPTTEGRSRGDCNYLFSSPSIKDPIPSISLATALTSTQMQRDRVLEERGRLQDKLQDDIDWLLTSIRVSEERESKARQMAADAQAKTRQVEAVLRGVERSTTWRVLNAWRAVRDRGLPAGTGRRRVYESVVGNLRGRPIRHED
jgi:FkbM family methyltransferase